MRLLVGSLLCALALAPAVELTFRASQTTLARTATLERTGELAIAVTIDGEPALDVNSTSKVAEARTLRVTDALGKLENARPKTMRRTFQAFESTIEYERDERSSKVTHVSPLVGETVVFIAKQADAPLVGVWPPDRRGDEELLEDLVEDLDLRGLLPAHAVAVGDSWKADVSVVRDLLFPGGDLKSHSKNAAAAAPEDRKLAQDLGRDIEGNLTVRLESVEGELARLALTLDVKLTGSSPIPTAADTEFRSPVRGTRQVTWTYEGGGSATWHVAKGRLTSLELAADALETEIETTTTPFPSGTIDVVTTSTFTGKLTLGLSIR